MPPVTGQKPPPDTAPAAGGIGACTRSFDAVFAGAERRKVGQETMGDDRSLVRMRERRACGAKRGEGGWTKNSVDLGLEGGIKCDGCWIDGHYWMGEKTPKPHTQGKQVRKGGLAEKGEMAEGIEAGRQPEDGPRRQELCTQQGRAFWNGIFLSVMPGRTEDFQWLDSERHPQPWGEKMKSEEDNKTH